MAVHVLITSLLIFLSLPKQSISCPETSCSPTTQTIRFPFGLNSDNHRRRCSYPGFNLSCDKNNQTTLNLPFAGDFLVTYIHYQTQQIRIRDPGDCLAGRFIKNFSLAESPFFGRYDGSFIFVNCSQSNISMVPPLPYARYVGCLSNENYTVLGVPAEYEEYVRGLNACRVVAREVEVPVMWSRVAEGDTTLFWLEPDCLVCEQSGGTCGLEDGSDYDIGCFDQPSKGLPRSAKYGLIIGAGIPGLLCIIGLGCYLGGRFRTYNPNPNPNSTTNVSTTFTGPHLMSTAGLDGSTIELYPKILLGESRRLPKPSDNTCPLCLSEYQPKETLRTIPDCNHYFHAECVDEWLKMNATCPVCRNSPDVSSMETPTSSLSSSSIVTISTSSSSER